MMKEIKAYSRPTQLNEVIQALEEKGAPGITVVDVHPVGYGFEPNYFTEARTEMDRFPQIAKIEIVCHDEQIGDLVDVILGISSTGSPGDGRIFVTPVEEVVRVRNGLHGANIL